MSNNRLFFFKFDWFSKYNINNFLELLVKKETNIKLLDACLLFHQGPLAANPERIFKKCRQY